MIRVAFTCFVASLLLITWLDDIYQSGQTPNDPSNDCSCAENDTYLATETHELSASKVVKDVPDLSEMFRPAEVRINFALANPLPSSFRVLRRDATSLYVFMSLQR
jgi:hypothetical protein